MFLIIGTRFFSWGQERTNELMHCGNCGSVVSFIVKKGMQFITLFFLIPVIPISGVKYILQCPNCGTRYQGSSRNS
jgi:transcription elongation factor Elf1